MTAHPWDAPAEAPRDVFCPRCGERVGWLRPCECQAPEPVPTPNVKTQEALL